MLNPTFPPSVKPATTVVRASVGYNKPTQFRPQLAQSTPAVQFGGIGSFIRKVYTAISGLFNSAGNAVTELAAVHILEEALEKQGGQKTAAQDACFTQVGAFTRTNAKLESLLKDLETNERQSDQELNLYEKETRPDVKEALNKKIKGRALKVKDLMEQIDSQKKTVIIAKQNADLARVNLKKAEDQISATQAALSKAINAIKDNKQKKEMLENKRTLEAAATAASGGTATNDIGRMLQKIEEETAKLDAALNDGQSAAELKLDLVVNQTLERAAEDDAVEFLKKRRAERASEQQTQAQGSSSGASTGSSDILDGLK